MGEKKMAKQQGRQTMLLMAANGNPFYRRKNNCKNIYIRYIGLPGGQKQQKQKQQQQQDTNPAILLQLRKYSVLASLMGSIRAKVLGAFVLKKQSE